MLDDADVSAAWRETQLYQFVVHHAVKEADCSISAAIGMVKHVLAGADDVISATISAPISEYSDEVQEVSRG